VTETLSNLVAVLWQARSTLADTVLTAPVVQAALAEAELKRSTTDRLASPHERTGSQTELGRTGSWHQMKPPEKARNSLRCR